MTRAGDAQKVVQKSWGVERWIVNDAVPGYCMKVMEIAVGDSCSIHMHPVKDECWWIVDGTLLVDIGDQPGGEFRQIRLEPGCSLRVKPLVYHRFKGAESPSGVVRFVESSTFHDDDDVERVET